MVSLMSSENSSRSVTCLQEYNNWVLVFPPGMGALFPSEETRDAVMQVMASSR